MKYVNIIKIFTCFTEGVILPSTKNILHNLSSEIGKILNELSFHHSIKGVSLFLIEMNE